MAKKTKKRDNERVHVRLEGPISKRKLILSAAIDVVELMKKQDSIKNLRTEKHKEMENYRTIMKEVHSMLTALGLKDVKIKGKEKEPISVKIKNAPKRAKVLKKGSGLDDQLDALRRKLQTI